MLSIQSIFLLSFAFHAQASSPFNETNVPAISVTDEPAFSPSTMAPSTALPTTTAPVTPLPSSVPLVATEEAEAAPTSGFVWIPPVTPSPTAAIDVNFADADASLSDYPSSFPSNFPSDMPSDFSTSTGMCDAHSGCAALDLTGACCPTIDGWMLSCCDSEDDGDVRSSVEPTCEANPTCAAMTLTGDCCPTADTSMFLDCCSSVPDFCQEEGACTVVSARDYLADTEASMSSVRVSSVWIAVSSSISMLALSLWM